MGSNKTYTPEELEAQMQDFMNSGLDMKDYANAKGLNYSTFKSRVQNWKKKQGIPLERKGFVRSANSSAVIPARPSATKEAIKEEIKMNDDIEALKQRAIQETPKEKNPVGRPGLTYKETKYSFGMKEEDFDLLRAYCTITQTSIKEVIQKSIYEYLEKAENQSAMNEARKLLKMIRRK